MSKKITRQVAKPTPVVEEPAKSLTSLPKVVIVKWVDIVSDLVWNDHDGKDLELPIFHTVGFFLSEDDEKLVIHDTQPGTGNRCAFPKGCILELKYVEES